MLSGLTVALALVPEAIAFSFVAHVDPIIGLYAAFMMGLITSIFGGRPGMISGATGAVAVIFAPLVIQQTKVHGMDGAIGYLFLAVIIMGLIQVAFGLLKWGKFIRLIPHPVMLGFVNGLAIVIFKAQFSQFYIGTGDQATLLPTQPLLVMIGLIALTMAITHWLPKITKAVPASLTAIGVVSLISIGLKSNGIDVLTVIDFVKNMDPTKHTIAASLPQFSVPNVPLDWASITLVLPYAILAASVGLIESLMTLVLIDELTETRGRGNKESIGQGIANIINGFFGGMGGCAMIGQSMINIRAGGRGRLSGITAAVCLLGFIVFGAPLIEQIPLAALVGVMFMVVIATFEWSSFRVMRKIPRSDALIIILVSIVTVIVDLAIAVLLGVIVAALVFAWEKGKRMAVTTFIDASGTKHYELDGALFFGSVTSFKSLFCIHEDPNDVIIDFKSARVYDHSGLEAIQNISHRYSQVNKRVHLLNVSPECRDLLHKADNIVEVSIIDDLKNWHIAEDRLA